MTVEEARIIVLEDALRQAQNTVNFLHGCLTDPQFSYAYPEMTLSNLEHWSKLAPVPPGCAHGRHHEDCEPCQAHIARSQQLAEAKGVLG